METVVMSIEEELQACISQLDIIQKKSLLEMIKSFVKKEEFKPQMIEQYNKELEEAEAEYCKGEYISHEEMLNHIKEW